MHRAGRVLAIFPATAIINMALHVVRARYSVTMECCRASPRVITDPPGFFYSIISR